MAGSLEFHLAEYGSLRDEMLAIQAERRSIDRLGLAGVVAMSAWILTNAASLPSALIVKSIWFLPFTIALACLILSRRMTRSIGGAAHYMSLIENKFADPAILGWHTTLARIRAGAEDRSSGLMDGGPLADEIKLNPVSGLTRQFWFAVTALAFAFGCAGVINFQLGEVA